MNKPISSKCIIESLYVDVPSRRVQSVYYGKISDNNFIIPKEEEYNFLVCKNYRVSQLKTICRKYGLKVSGNKEQLKYRIYNYLRLSVTARKIQKIMKTNFIQKYNLKHGPARLNRGLCVNETDFYTMDKLTEVSYDNFYSFTDVDSRIYGFDILSIYKMFSKNNTVANPYNRKEIPSFVRKEIRFLIKKNNIYRRVANGGEEIVIEEVSQSPLTERQKIELRTLEVFQKMDQLDNITNTEWFLTLGRPQIIRFIRSLADIWHHRAELSLLKQREICPPYGNPFRIINLYGLSAISTETLQRISLSLMEKMVVTGVDRDSKCLGSYYVLCALTLVNENAALSLPWLYQSVIENPESPP